MPYSLNFARFSACAALSLAWLSGPTAQAQAAEQDRPLNVVLMLADDMGYADVNAFGGRFGYTPNLDRLAAMGMTMTDFHSACAVCSPTRAALLTGRYPLANGIDGHFPDKPSTFLRDQTRADGGPGTLPGLLQEQGYSTFHVGKWHLGGVTLVELEHRAAGQGEYAQNQGPHEHGFDHYYISLEDAPSGIRSGMIRSATLYRDGVKHLVHNDVYTHDPDQQRDWQGFKGDVVTQHIAQCTEAGKPFYLNVWFDVPHTPYESAHVPAEFHFDTLSQQFDQTLGRNRHVLNTDLPAGKHQENHRRFLSMVTYMDHQVGRILDALDDPNGDGDTADSMMDNTLIIFTSDNGGAWPADNGVFASGKACVRNGGIRVPMIVAWENHITPGTTSLQIGNTIDLLPSVHRLATREDLPAGLTVDGIDLSPVWLGEDEQIDRGVMFSDLRKSYGPQRHGPRPEPQGHFVARRGDLKLIFDHKRSLQPVALFDMSTDAGEQNNLIDQPEYADDIIELTEAAKGWVDEMDEAAGAGSGE